MDPSVKGQGSGKKDEQDSDKLISGQKMEERVQPGTRKRDITQRGESATDVQTNLMEGHSEQKRRLQAGFAGVKQEEISPDVAMVEQTTTAEAVVEQTTLLEAMAAEGNSPVETVDPRQVHITQGAGSTQVILQGSSSGSSEYKTSMDFITPPQSFSSETLSKEFKTAPQSFSSETSSIEFKTPPQSFSSKSSSLESSSLESSSQGSSSLESSSKEPSSSSTEYDSLLQLGDSTSKDVSSIPFDSTSGDCSDITETAFELSEEDLLSLSELPADEMEEEKSGI